MSHFVSLIFEDIIVASFAFSFLFFFLFFLSFIIQYIYVSKNLKGICKIMFNDEKAYKLPLEPFNFYFLSLLPIVFWRETLNIKKNMKFKKLYGKEFYFKIEKDQLIKLLNKYPLFFYIQYAFFIFGMLWLVFSGFGYILDKFF